jgi:hypothetical protein
MKDKALFRMLVVQYLDSFKEMIAEGNKNSDLQNLMLELNRNNITEIELPESFERVFQKNIELKCHYDIEINEITLDSGKPNWGNIKYELQEELKNSISRTLRFDSKDEKDEYLKEYKKGLANSSDEDFEGRNEEERIIGLKLELVIIALQEAWKIISKFFPLSEYGLPSRRLLDIIINFILGEDVDIKEPLPFINKTVDHHSLLLELENKYLKDKLRDNSIDYMESEEFICKKLMLLQLLEKNPQYSVIISPLINKTQFSNEFDNINDSIEALKLDFNNNLEELISSFSQVEEDAYLYADKRFNKKMSGTKIVEALSEKVNEFSKKKIHTKWDEIVLKKAKSGMLPGNINRDIVRLSRNTGFEKVNEKICKKMNEK